MRALLAPKTDVNAKRGDGATALMLASQNGHPEVVRALPDAKTYVFTRAKSDRKFKVGRHTEIPAKDGKPQAQGEIEIMNRNGRLLPVKALVALALLAIAPCRADDLVFPQGAYIKLSSADKKAYARLDFALGTCPQVYPNKIVAADKSSWEVPVPHLKVGWRIAYPTIYVPSGEYVFSLRAQAQRLLGGCGCANTELNLGVGKCIASCTSYAVLEPGEMTLPWKAEAGEHYEITTTFSVGAPMPVVEWGGGVGRCPYSVSPPLPGGGTATICVKKIERGGQPPIDSACRDTHYFLEVMSKTGSGRRGPPTATVGPGEQPKETAAVPASVPEPAAPAGPQPARAAAQPAAASNDEQKSTAPKSAAQGSATSPATGAPTVHAEDTCSGGWKSVAAKIPGSKVALALSTTKEGQERLQWPNPKGEVVTVQVTKAQAPVNAQGKIVVCTTGGSIGLFGDSISLGDLAKNPQPGYYAVQVTIGGQVYPVHIPGDTSDWITIQIKEADTKKPEGVKF